MVDRRTILPIPDVPPGQSPLLHDFLTAVKANAEGGVSPVTIVKTIKTSASSLPPQIGLDPTVPSPPTNFSVAPGVWSNVLTWDLPDESVISGTEVWVSTTGSRSEADRIAIVTKPLTVYRHQPEVYTDDHYYWIRSISYAGKYSVWVPRDTMGGELVEGADSIGETVDEVLAQLLGKITTSELSSSLNNEIGRIDTIESQIASLTSTPYSSTTTYYLDDVVEYNDTLYRCIDDNSGSGITNIVPTNATYWETQDSLYQLISQLGTDIDVLEAWQTTTESTIVSHTSTLSTISSDLNDPTTGLKAKLSAAESRIASGEDGTWASISNKVQASVYDADINAETTGLKDRTALAEATLSAQSDDIDNLKAEYFLKLSVDGYISGFGLFNDGDTSEAIFLVDTFAIAKPGFPTKYPFVVGEVDGVSTVGINGNLVVDETILARHIAADQIRGEHIEAATIKVGAFNPDLKALTHNSYNVQGSNLVRNAQFVGDHTTFWHFWQKPESGISFNHYVLDSSELEGNVEVQFAGDYLAFNSLKLTFGKETVSSETGIKVLAVEQNHGPTGVPSDYVSAYNRFTVPVEAGKNYIASAYVAAGNCDVYIWIDWQDSSGAWLDYTWGMPGNVNYLPSNQFTGGPVLNDFKRIFITGMPPAGARTMRLVLGKYDTKEGSTNSYMLVTRPMISEGGLDQSEPVPWSTSPQVDYVEVTDLSSLKPEDGATRGATWGSDIVGQPADVMIRNDLQEWRDIQNNEWAFDGDVSWMDGGKIYSNTVMSDKIMANQILSYHIRAGQISSLHVGTNELVANTANIRGGVINNQHVGTNLLVADQANIADGVIVTAHIADATIGSAQMKYSSIDSAHIKGAAITDAHIQNAAITNAKIKDASISSAKIQNASIASGHIQNASVDTLKIKENAVTVPIGVYTDGAMGIQGNIEQTIQSLKIVSENGAIIVMFAFILSNTDSSWGIPTVRLYRGDQVNIGTLIMSFTFTPGFGSVPFSFSYHDRPGAGDHTYRVRASGPLYDPIFFSRRSLILFEAKR